MRTTAPSLTGLIGSRLAHWSFKPADYRDPDLVAQIPPEMLAQLQREGWRNLVAAPFVAIGAMTFIGVLLQATGISDSGTHTRDTVTFILVMLLLSAFRLRATLQAPVAREVRFFRLHGKWRWEP